MEQYTLIGHPLGHSMSPFIHERLFAMAGRKAEYTLTDIAPEHLLEKEPFLRSLQGFNITIPHKMAVIPMVDRLDESARRYDSVNCVANVDGKLVGYVLINASENAGIYTSLISGGVPLESLQGDLMDSPNLFWFPKETRITKLRGGVQL